jgi:catalase-peroxidase
MSSSSSSSSSAKGQCPVVSKRTPTAATATAPAAPATNRLGRGGTSNRDWWPHQLNLDGLLSKNSNNNLQQQQSSYAKEFAQLDYAALKQDLRTLMTDSQEWWPADYGHYGPFFIRYEKL